MPETAMIFARTEKKYMITEDIAQKILEKLGPALRPDPHGESTVCNIYLDTPDFRMIRESMNATTYKEKLRLRSYGNAADTTDIFFEIKKKYAGTVYKRREILPFSEAKNYIALGIKTKDSQIFREIDYAMQIHARPQPAMTLCYDRSAFFFRENSECRITFDRNIRYRTEDIALCDNNAMTKILPDNAVLMEFKTPDAMPMELCRILSDLHVYSSKFSKYGTCYTDLLKKQQNSMPKEAVHYA